MVSKLRGKDWYQIVAPKFFGDFVIGETPAMDSNQLIGRVIETSLTDFTGDPSKYYLKLYFKIKKIEENKAITEFLGHDCTRDYLARIVRKRTTRIDTNDIIELVDKKMRVKSIAISNRHVSRSLEIKIRKMLRDNIREMLRELKTEEFIKEMIGGKIQQNIRKTISKVYPLRFFEFRKTEVIPS